MNNQKPKELVIQEAISEYLVLNNIYSASVLYCESAPASIPNVCITLFSKIDLQDFLNLIDYQNLCDRSGIIVFNDTNTILLCGLIMKSFFSTIWESLKTT